MRDDLQDIVDEVSRLLGAPATLEDLDFTLLAFCAQGEGTGGGTGGGTGEDPGGGQGTALDAVRTRSILTRGSPDHTRRWFSEFGIDAAVDPLRTPADPAAGILTRLCLPVRHAGRLHGWLWLLDEGRTDVTDPATGPLGEAVALAARAGRLLGEPRSTAADLAAELHAALTGEHSGRSRRLLEATLGPDTPVALVALRPAWALPADWTPPGAGAVSTVLGRWVAVLLPLPHTADGRPAGALTAAALRGLPAGSTAGVATARVGCAELPEQWQEARDAARVAAVEPRLAPVASWAELGAWRQVVRLPGPDPVLAPLLGDPVLTRTAEVWLDCAGSPQRAAAELCVHRQTLYYRLGRIIELTGLDLADGADRLALHLAVRTHRLVQADRGPATDR